MMSIDRRVVVVVAGGLAASAVVVLFAVFPVQAWLGSLATTLASYGTAGSALFGLLFVACALALVPVSALCLVSGLVYGPAGLLLAWVAIMIAAWLSQPLARRWLAPAVLDVVRRRRELAAILAVVTEEGWRMVLLVRLSGIVPFGLQNYLFGIADVRIAPYMAATAVGVMPSLLVYGGAGALGQAALAGGYGNPIALVIPALAVAGGVGLVVITVRRVRAKLAAALPPG